jgi:hypothetical protein
MRYKNRSFLVLSILFMMILLSSYVIIVDSKPPTNLRSRQFDDIQVSTFSKEDYAPILTVDKQRLGNITITDSNFNEAGFFNDSSIYPLLDNDLESQALKMIYQSTIFVATVKNATVENSDPHQKDFRTIIIRLNDTVSVEFNNSIQITQGFLIYGLRLSPTSIREVYVQDQGSTDIIKLSADDYFINSKNFINFDYYSYFMTNYHNFTLHILYDYDIIVEDWTLHQLDEITLRNQTQIISPRFIYNFTIAGMKFDGESLTIKAPALNFFAEFKLYLPDRNKLFDHEMSINNIITTNYLDSQKRVNFSTSLDYSNMILNFTANFTVSFENALNATWAIDRLIDANNLRQRIYFPSIIEGPERLILEDLTIFEETITVDQVTGNYSLFDRDVQYYDANVSIVQGDLENSLIFTKNSIKKKGIRMILPYLVAGETDPCIIEYTTTKDLNIIITDNIYMPLLDVEARLFYFGKEYGTYISSNYTQPISIEISDQYGKISVKNVPNGDYVIKLYRDNQFLTEANVDPFNEVNYIVTDIIHFPLWILIFGTISLTLLIVGILLYLSRKKR